MAINKDKKKKIYEKIADIVQNSPSIAFVKFHGLGVSETTEMRKALRDAGVSYFVAKKTLIKRALADKGITGDEPILEGEIGLTYTTTLSGDDGLIAPSREVYAFQKKFKDAVSIVGGVFEKKYKDKIDMTDIAAIPPTHVMYGQIANLFNSPIQQFVMALGQIAEKKS